MKNIKIHVEINDKQRWRTTTEQTHAIYEWMGGGGGVGGGGGWSYDLSEVEADAAMAWATVEESMRTKSCAKRYKIKYTIYKRIRGERINSYAQSSYRKPIGRHYEYIYVSVWLFVHSHKRTADIYERRHRANHTTCESHTHTQTHNRRNYTFHKHRYHNYIEQQQRWHQQTASTISNGPKVFLFLLN